MLIESLKQLDLLAQGPNISGDVIVLIVMAVLWLVGGLAKVLTSRKGPAQPSQQQPGVASKPPAQRETWQQRLVRKAREMQQAAEAESRKLEEQAQKAESRPAGTITVRKDRKGDSVMVYQHAEAERRVAHPHKPREPVRATRPEISREYPGAFEPFDASSEATAPSQVAYPSTGIDLGLNDPDGLMAAILHYEILGKPLALRDSSDGVTQF